MIDNRITLPLDAVRLAAERLCEWTCDSPVYDDLGMEHEAPCLVPLLDARDALLASDRDRAYTEGLDPDCIIGGAKHAACTGCSCDCHRHSRRTP